MGAVQMNSGLERFERADGVYDHVPGHGQSEV